MLSLILNCVNSSIFVTHLISRGNEMLVKNSVYNRPIHNILVADFTETIAR